MNTCVCVLSNNGERLMPTFRLSKVRRLLKDGKAKIVKHHPFTIQLLYDSKTNTQPIEIYATITNYRIRSEWTALHI